MAKEPIWHRQSDETTEDYALFELYLRERNMAEVARQYFGERGERAVETGRIYIVQVKKKRRWAAREQAYDRWIAQQRDDATKAVVQNKVKEIGKRQVQLINQTEKIVRRALQNIENERDPEKQTLYQADLAAQVVTRIFGLYQKLVEANPEAEESKKPFENEIAGAQAQLIRFVEKNQKYIKPDTGAEEIVQ